MTRLVLLVLACLAAAPLRADTAPLRFRGVVEAREGELLRIRRPGGSTVTMQMNARTRIFAAAPGRVPDIKPESYLSIVSGGAGPEPFQAEQAAARVAVYSPSERGFEAGRKPWDTGPGESLTAGWVDELSAGPARRVRLRYPDGSSAFVIPAGTPVTAISPGEKAQLVPGAAVTAFAQTSPDGTLAADVVAVGRLGAVPAL